jgi:hypothetical protein
VLLLACCVHEEAERGEMCLVLMLSISTASEPCSCAAPIACISIPRRTARGAGSICAVQRLGEDVQRVPSIGLGMATWKSNIDSIIETARNFCRVFINTSGQYHIIT